MDSKALAEFRNKFYEFLSKDGPRNKKECTLYEDKNGKFYLVVGGMTANNVMLYTINGHFWYDWTETFAETGEWKVIYQRRS